MFSKNGLAVATCVPVLRWARKSTLFFYDLAVSLPRAVTQPSYFNLSETLVLSENEDNSAL